MARQCLPSPRASDSILTIKDNTTEYAASPTALSHRLRLKDGGRDRRRMKGVVAAGQPALRVLTAEVIGPRTTSSQVPRAEEMRAGEKGTVLGRVDGSIDAARCPNNPLGRSGWRSQGPMPDARFERRSRTPGTPPPTARWNAVRCGARAVRSRLTAPFTYQRHLLTTTQVRKHRPKELCPVRSRAARQCPPCSLI